MWEVYCTVFKIYSHFLFLLVPISRLKLDYKIAKGMTSMMNFLPVYLLWGSNF